MEHHKEGIVAIDLGEVPHQSMLERTIGASVRINGHNFCMKDRFEGPI